MITYWHVAVDPRSNRSLRLQKPVLQFESISSILFLFSSKETRPSFWANGESTLVTFHRTEAKFWRFVDLRTVTMPNSWDWYNTNSAWAKSSTGGLRSLTTLMLQMIEMTISYSFIASKTNSTSSSSIWQGFESSSISIFSQTRH